MARLVLGSYLVRFPLGGYLSWVLQWLVGLQRLGHEVYFVEKYGWANSCFNPMTKTMSDDCSYGISTLNELLTRFDLKDHWCFVDAHERYCGLSRERIEEIFATSDLFIEMGTHGDWAKEASRSALRVQVDGEPAATQIKMTQRLDAGQALPEYDCYYSVGQNIGTNRTIAPSAGKNWRHVFYPIVTGIFPVKPADADAPFTTIMSWQAHTPIEFGGITYGAKDVEFSKFIDLPRRVAAALEIAVTEGAPMQRLAEAGWRIRNSHAASVSFDSFRDYISCSRGEFSVCKNVFVATKSGWFGDRAAAYLASGRPVVMQDTGFSEHLPCGCGLFAVNNVEEAAEAIAIINRDYERHSKKARDIALEFLDTEKVLPRFLSELGIGKSAL